MLQARIKPYFGDRAFYKKTFTVMIPIILQQMINALFNFADNLMVSHVGPLHMSAVTVANKPYMIYMGIFFGFTGAAGLLLSQYYGAKKLEVCQRIFSVEMLFGICISLVYAAVLALFPEQIMRIFVKDPYTIEIGVSYMQVIALSYIPAAISSVCIFSLRALGINLIPMVVSICTILFNVFFNWIFIFGHFGAPAMGARGAALGTLFARLLEVIFYITILALRKTPFSLRLGSAFRIGKQLLRDYVQKAIPLLTNELLWSTGLLIFFWSYASLSEPSLPAITVADQVFNIAWVLFLGTSSAISVMVGTSLGAGDFEGAKGNAKKLMALGLIISLICFVLCNIGALFIDRIFVTLTDELLSVTRQLIFINAIFYPLHAMNAICFYLLRAGGDTRNTMLMDGGYMWLVPVPASLLIGLFLPGKMSIQMGFFLVQFLSNIKFVLALRLVKKGHWLRNLTRPENADTEP